MNSDINKRFEDIKKLDKAYQDGHPMIDDGSFDTIYAEFVDYVNKHKDEVPKEMIDYVNHAEPDIDLKEKSRKIHHPYPILSLAKSQTIDGLRKYLAKWNNDNESSEWYTDKFIVERKEDGLTVVLYFNDDTMNKDFVAVTRGGGHEGQDITDKAMNFCNLDINAIKKKIGKRHVVIRGEAMIDDNDFDEINIDGQFANSRNAASGTLMANDPTLVAKRHMKFYAYNLVNKNEFIDEDFDELRCMQFINDLGVEVTGEVILFNNDSEGIERMLDFISTYNDTLRESVGHAIDGLVIKPNCIKHLDQIGYTGHHPNSDIAFKFKAEKEIAILDRVEWQKSINGKLTPVGILDHPVNILGATIQKASLASIQNIENRDIMLYDHVIIRRSNDVIPQIVGPVKELRDGSEVDIHDLIPEGTERKGAVLYQKPDIKEQLFQSWIKFVGKDGLNLDGISGQTLKTMIDNNVIDINDYSSIWRIDHDLFTSIKGLGEKKYWHLQEQLKETRPDLRNLLLALPIEGLGFKLADQVANEIKELLPEDDPKELEEIVWEKLSQRSGFGPHTKAILDELFTEENFVKLFQIGEYVPLEHYVVEEPEPVQGILSNIHFVITGRFELKRKEIEQIIIENGGIIDGSINTNTNYLLKNGSRESNKTKKAKQLGVEIIDWNAFLDMID